MKKEQAPETDNSLSGPAHETTETAPWAGRFPELAEIEREVAARIRDNQRFLDRFMDEDFTEDEEDQAEEDGDFEEI